MRRAFSLISFVLLFVTLGFGQTRQSANASIPLPKNIRPATDQELSALHAKVASRRAALNSGQLTTTGSGSTETMDPVIDPLPIFVVTMTGNSYSGITAQACNARVIPDSTMFWGQISVAYGAPTQKLVFLTFGEIPAGQFCMPIDTERKFDWADGAGSVQYDVQSYSYQTGDFLGISTAQKLFGKFDNNSGLFEPVKLINDGVTQNVGNITFLNLSGKIVGSVKKTSIVLQDANAPAWLFTAVPPTAIKVVGNQVQINLKTAGFSVVPDEEILVTATSSDGVSSSYTAVVK